MSIGSKLGIFDHLILQAANAFASQILFFGENKRREEVLCTFMFVVCTSPEIVTQFCLATCNYFLEKIGQCVNKNLALW